MEKTKSQMLVIPAGGNDLKNPEILVKRLYEAEDFRVESAEAGEECLQVTVICGEESFSMEMYPTGFSIPELYRCQHFFPDIDIEAIQKLEYGLAVEMVFGVNALSSYHLQLKLIHAMLPDALAVIDDSSEKILSGRWVALAAESEVPPAPRYLYTAQAVSGEEDCVWLHTHGLNRCGRPELEVLASTKDNYQEHYNVLETLANRILEDEEVPEFGSPYFLAYVAEGMPLVVTLIDWEEAVELYEPDMLGGKRDRKDGHDRDTCVVFVYPSQESADKGEFYPLDIYDKFMKENPVFMISNEETDRMRAQAVERISYLFDAAADQDNHILVKIGLPVDEEHKTQDNEREHIWFELLEVSGDRFQAKLTQEPYYIKDMHEGFVGEYGPEDVTDWLIYTPEGRISPDDVYRLSV
jgi:hypothetical protein